MIRNSLISFCFLFFLVHFAVTAQSKPAPKLNTAKICPNIVLIYADDVGFGDISANGATKVHTPNIDQIAKHGINFTNAYATASVCTPSRFSLLTVKYTWRQKGTGVAPGNAALLISVASTTLASVFQKSGYNTGVVGKWHIGLGAGGGPDWNGYIAPGPLEIGFDYSFIIPATLDRVPCVFVENHRVANLEPRDSIAVSYGKPIGNEPTGYDHPELLKVRPSYGHNQTIINGISRIGYMSGGKSARWNDEEIGNVLTGKATDFIKSSLKKPFFLYFAVHGIHVPRVPNPKFAGKSGLGPRGDAILEMDDMVGRVQRCLDSLNLTKNTILIFSSDNGPVLDDGYQDGAVELLHGHKPAGKMRGGKYSAFDAGTRVPFLIEWPAGIKGNSTSDAKISQIDLLRSFASLTGYKIPAGQAPDSFNLLSTLLGQDHKGRSYIVQQSVYDTYSIIIGDWKYIAPHAGPAFDKFTGIELGNSSEPQLYNLKNDIGEKNNVAKEHPTIVKQLADQLSLCQAQQ